MLLHEMPSASGLLPSAAVAPSTSTVMPSYSLDPAGNFNFASAFLPTVSSSFLTTQQLLASLATSQPSLFAQLLAPPTVSTANLAVPGTNLAVPSPNLAAAAANMTLGAAFGVPSAPATRPSSAVKEERRTPCPPPARSTRVFDEKCVVCSDRATGLHYSVPSCNGCKTFFRRTIICGRRFKCHKDGQCTFNKQGRCSCRACRFQKCIDSGMDPQAIQQSRYAPYPPGAVASTSYADPKDTPSPYATKDLGEMLGEACTRPDSPLSPSALSSTGVSPVPPQLDTKSIQSFIENEDLRDLVTREIKMYGLRRSGGYKGGALLDILTKPPAIDNKDSLMEICEAPLLIGDRTEFWLNYELSISLEYAKTHAVFRNLSFCDKCVLIEDTHIALFIFTAAYEAYFKEGKQLHYCNGDEVVFGEDTGSPNDLIDIMTRCSLDPATFALSKAIIFLNPDAYGLSPEGKALLEQERDRHMRLLASYTFQRFTSRGAAILAESILLPATTLALGRRMKNRPPANAALLYISKPMPVKKEALTN